MDEYKIHLVNGSMYSRTFWCFLAMPERLGDGFNVFANSTVSLEALPINDLMHSSTFTIPVQYVLGAGASNKAVGLNASIESSISSKVDLGQTWTAEYVDTPPKQGPKLSQTEATLENLAAKPIIVQSNPFDKVKNEQNGWYSSMSFGIQTEAGFMGSTWSPDPGKTEEINPTLRFFISIGRFSNSKLVSFSTMSAGSATVNLSDFDNFEATVTLGPNGRWRVTRGNPGNIRSA